MCGSSSDLIFEPPTNFQAAARAMFVLVRIRRSSEDLRALVDLIDGSAGEAKDTSVALNKLEALGIERKLPHRGSAI